MPRYNVMPNPPLPELVEVFRCWLAVKMTHTSAVSFQWMEAGKSGQSGPPVGQSAPTGAVASVKPPHLEMEESTAAAAWWRAKTAQRGCVRAVSHPSNVFELGRLLNVKRESIFGSYIFICNIS